MTRNNNFCISGNCFATNNRLGLVFVNDNQSPFTGRSIGKPNVIYADYTLVGG